MDTRILIPAKDAVVFWNDNPLPNIANCVRIVSIHDPRMDQLGRGFENSAGAMLSEWMTRPEATPRWIFDDFMGTSEVSRLDPLDWEYVREAWLIEFSKIEGCEWAAKELDIAFLDDGPISKTATEMFGKLARAVSVAKMRLSRHVRSLPDAHFGDLFGLVHSEWNVMGLASPAWISLVMEVTEEEAKRRALLKGTVRR